MRSPNVITLAITHLLYSHLEEKTSSSNGSSVTPKKLHSYKVGVSHMGMGCFLQTTWQLCWRPQGIATTQAMDEEKFVIQIQLNSVNGRMDCLTPMNRMVFIWRIIYKQQGSLAQHNWDHQWWRICIYLRWQSKENTSWCCPPLPFTIYMNLIFMVLWDVSSTTLALHFSSRFFTKYVAIVGKENFLHYFCIFLDNKCLTYWVPISRLHKPPYSERMNLRDGRLNSSITLH